MIMCDGAVNLAKVESEILDCRSVLSWLHRDIKYCMIMYRKLNRAGRRKEAKRFYNKARRYRKEAKVWKKQLQRWMEVKEYMRRPARA